MLKTKNELGIIWVYFACLLQGENESEFPTEVHFLPTIEEGWRKDQGRHPGSLIKQSMKGKVKLLYF